MISAAAMIAILLVLVGGTPALSSLPLAFAPLAAAMAPSAILREPVGLPTLSSMPARWWVAPCWRSSSPLRGRSAGGGRDLAGGAHPRHLHGGRRLQRAAVADRQAARRTAVDPPRRRADPAEARQTAARARAAGQPVIELGALSALERSYRLDAVLRAKPTAAEEARLAELLLRRAMMFHVLGRPIPESRDLEAVASLDPGPRQHLIPQRAAAAAAAGDCWKAIDAPAEAGAAFILAARLGGARPDAPPFRPPAPIPINVPLDIERWVLGGPALSGRLLPLAAARPAS